MLTAETVNNCFICLFKYFDRLQVLMSAAVLIQHTYSMCACVLHVYDITKRKVLRFKRELNIRTNIRHDVVVVYIFCIGSD